MKITVSHPGTESRRIDYDPSKHRNVLDSLEANDIEAHYHCKDGFCGACRCKLKSGSVSYPNEPLAFIRDGEILTCCSQPEEDLEIIL